MKKSEETYEQGALVLVAALWLPSLIKDKVVPSREIMSEDQNA